MNGMTNGEIYVPELLKLTKEVQEEVKELAGLQFDLCQARADRPLGQSERNLFIAGYIAAVLMMSKAVGHIEQMLSGNEKN